MDNESGLGQCFESFGNFLFGGLKVWFIVFCLGKLLWSGRVSHTEEMESTLFARWLTQNGNRFPRDWCWKSRKAALNHFTDATHLEMPKIHFWQVLWPKVWVLGCQLLKVDGEWGKPRMAYFREESIMDKVPWYANTVESYVTPWEECCVK